MKPSLIETRARHTRRAMTLIELSISLAFLVMLMSISVTMVTWLNRSNRAIQSQHHHTRETERLADDFRTMMLRHESFRIEEDGQSLRVSNNNQMTKWHFDESSWQVRVEAMDAGHQQSVRRDRYQLSPSSRVQFTPYAANDRFVVMKIDRMENEGNRPNKASLRRETQRGARGIQVLAQVVTQSEETR